MNIYTIQALHEAKNNLKERKKHLINMREDHLMRAKTIDDIDLPALQERIVHINDDLVKAGEPNDLL